MGWSWAVACGAYTGAVAASRLQLVEVTLIYVLLQDDPSLGTTEI